VQYIDAEECSYPLCVHLLSPSAFIRVSNSGPEFATADKRRWETRMDTDGFKEFPLHSSTAFPMHLITDAPRTPGRLGTASSKCRNSGVFLTEGEPAVSRKRDFSGSLTLEAESVTN
jgi:hypothetical protein